MASVTIKQVIPGSIDTAGISIATTNPDVGNPRTGQFYDTGKLAAAQPVWFHPLTSGGRYLALMARRLTSATVASPQAGSGPLMYSSSVEDSTPSWAVFDPASGTATNIATIPTDFVGDRVLVSAVSRGDYLFVLHRIGVHAIIQHFRVDSRSAISLIAEEMVPGNLGLGLTIARNDLWLWGAVNGKLTQARKNWGRIGENNSFGIHQRWRFRTARGWSSDVNELAPMPGNLSATGTVSVASHRNRFYLTMPRRTVASGGTFGTWGATTYTSREVDEGWTSHPFTVPLGSDDHTYAGGGVHFQPQLSLTPGYTSTTTRQGTTILDDGSDLVQVFTGVTGQIIVLPPTAPGPYTIYNKTILSELRVVTPDYTEVATIRPGAGSVFTKSGGSWAVTTPTSKTPDRWTGFPYVHTTRMKSLEGNATLLTQWGVFSV